MTASLTGAGLHDGAGAVRRPFGKSPSSTSHSVARSTDSTVRPSGVGGAHDRHMVPQHPPAHHERAQAVLADRPDGSRSRPGRLVVGPPGTS